MNLVNMICKELGVEVGEEWKGNDDNYYKINKDGNLVYFDDLEESVFEYEVEISKILTGKLKPMWKPKIDEDYWAVDFTEDDNVWSYIWSNDDFDNRLLHKDIVFKTKEEAIACANKMLNATKES